MKVILIVDDNDIQLTILASMFDSKEDTVVCMDNASEIVNIASALNPDLILLDLIMPKKGGDVAYSELKQDSSTKDIPIIFITADTGSFDFDTIGIRNGLDMVIPKPIVREDLHQAIQKRLTNQKISDTLNTAFTALNKLKICQCADNCSDELKESETNKDKKP
jgi:putative two-component system response regulator